MSSSPAITGSPLTVPDSWQFEAKAESTTPATHSLLAPSGFLSTVVGSWPLGNSFLDSLLLQRTSHFVIDSQSVNCLPVLGYFATPGNLTVTVSGKTTASSSSKTTAGNSTRGEWGFLNDSHMSIEDKLFQFIKLAQKKSDDELEKKMKEYRDKYCKSSQSSDSGGLFGFLGDLFSGGWLVDALKEVGSLIGKAGAAALGLTPLGSAFAQAGKAIAGMVSDALGVKSTSSSGTTKGEAGSPDERLDMLEIQRLADKQKQMFECVSNVLRVVHETAMAAVGNIR